MRNVSATTRFRAAAAAAALWLGLAAGGAEPPPPATAPTATPIATAVAAAPVGDAVPAVASPVPPPERPAFGSVSWRELRYSAHKLIFGATTTLAAERVEAAALAARLARPPGARAVPLPAGEAIAITSSSDLPFGRDETVTLWIDPATGAALGADKTTTGGNPYHKLLRFTDGGLYTWRSQPASPREERLAPQGWTKRKQYATSPAVRPPEGTPVTDAYALLYLVSAAGLDRKDAALRLVMLVDKAYVEVSFVAGGASVVRASFDESWPGGSRRREGNVLVRSVRATGRALGSAGAQDDVDLGFLGMRGALTLYLEVGTGVPVEFSGRVEHIGNLTVRLDRAALAAAPPADPAPAP